MIGFALNRLDARWQIAALAAVMVGLGGCDRKIDSRDPVQSLPPPPPSPINLTVQLDDRSATLSWEVTDSGAVDYFRIYRALGGDAPFVLFDSADGFSRTLTGLPYEQPVRLRVSSVSPQRVEGSPSEEMTVTLGLLSLVIADNAAYTNRRDVTVRLTVPTATSFVELSEDSLFASGSIPEPYRATLDFELSRGDGVKRVFGRFDFENGQRSGGPVFDEIVLDTRAHIDSVTFSPSLQPSGPGDTLLFRVAAGEPGGEATTSFSGVGAIELFDDGTAGDAIADDGFYSARYVVPVGVVVSDAVVTGAFTDAAGNRAETAIAAARLDIHPNTIPDAVTLAVALVDSARARLSWTESPDTDFESYRVYRSVSPGITEDDLFLMVAIVSSRTATGYDDFLAANGAYYYRVFVFDLEGLTSGSNEVVVTR